MEVAYSVTFGFETRSPMTHRGTILAAQPSTCFARAVRQAQKALRPTGWTSVVCLIDRRAFEQNAP